MLARNQTDGLGLVSVISELKRRNVFRVAALVAVLAILTVVADRLMPRDVPQAAAGAAAESPAPTAVTGAAERSIAVLPFVNMSADKDQEYFTDGISEELLNLLAKIPELKVIGRTSSFQFKGKNEDLRVIGQKLNVAHLLEGSVRKSGNRIRLTAQLIRADDGSHLWSETYDRTLDDIFAVQDEIAGEVVRALKLTLLGDALPATSRTGDGEAHALYLQGRYFADRRGPGDHKRAIDYFEQALARDPNFAMAWVELSAARTNNAQAMGVDMAAQLQQAREEARRAVEVDPQLPDGYASMAFDSMTLDWNWQEASRLLARARELDPNNLRTLRMTAHLASALGQFDEAIRLHQQVVAREPLVTSHHVNAALALRNAGKLTEAEQALQKALELSPDAGGVHYVLAGIHVLRGDASAALESLERETDEIWKELARPIVLHALGRRAESDQALKTLEEELAESAAFQIAEAHAFRGDTAQALEWLHRAYENRDGGLTEIKGDPFLKSIERDPRYLEIVRKIGLPT